MPVALEHVCPTNAPKRQAAKSPYQENPARDAPGNNTNPPRGGDLLRGVDEKALRGPKEQVHPSHDLADLDKGGAMCALRAGYARERGCSLALERKDCPAMAPAGTSS